MRVTYARFLREELPRAHPLPSMPFVLDLFAGCGGLSLGFESVGFRSLGYEVVQDAVDSYNASLAGTCVGERLTVASALPKADVIVAGPPCQPFSVGGKQRGAADLRDGFPTVVAAVERVRPRLVLIENVRGMYYRNREYLDRVLADLGKLGYRTTAIMINAADFGVPQRRERLVIIGTRRGVRFREPVPLSLSFAVRDALGRRALRASPDAKFVTPEQDLYIERYEAKSACRRPRDLRLEGPARTLTCRNLAGATGDMIRLQLPDGRRRRLSVREAARLQGFPDWFRFAGSEASRLAQLGNAVPPLLGRALASSVWQAIQ